MGKFLIMYKAEIEGHFIKLAEMLLAACTLPCIVYLRKMLWLVAWPGGNSWRTILSARFRSGSWVCAL
jgi:hypothetical protein